MGDSQDNLVIDGVEVGKWLNFVSNELSATNQYWERNKIDAGTCDWLPDHNHKIIIENIIVVEKVGLFDFNKILILQSNCCKECVVGKFIILHRIIKNNHEIHIISPAGGTVICNTKFNIKLFDNEIFTKLSVGSGHIGQLIYKNKDKIIKQGV